MLTELRGPLKQSLFLDAQKSTADVASVLSNGEIIGGNVVAILGIVSEVETLLGPDLQVLLDSVSVALRKISAHAPRAANLLNPVHGGSTRRPTPSTITNGKPSDTGRPCTVSGPGWRRALQHHERVDAGQLRKRTGHAICSRYCFAAVCAHPGGEMTNRRPWFLATVIPVVLALPSCTAINVNAIPQPGESYRGGHDIVMEFSNVLNLPERAKVVMDGTRVGVVTKVEVSQEAVDVTATVDPLISVPSNINPVLQQATVLGDLYISLERPRDGQAAPALGPAAKIPLAQTTSPPPLEATIANLANFVSSGSIQRIQNTMIGLNRVQPAGGQPALRKTCFPSVRRCRAARRKPRHGGSVVARPVANYSIDGRQKSPLFQYWFSPTGMAGFDRMFALGGSIIAALFFPPTVGTYLYSGGYWLVPLLETLSDGVGALQQNKWVFEDEYPAWQRLFTNYFLPQDKHPPAINITSIVGGPDGRELSGNVQDVLRILGAAP